MGIIYNFVSLFRLNLISIDVRKTIFPAPALKGEKLIFFAPFRVRDRRRKSK